MKPLSRKTKARISGALSPEIMLLTVMSVGAAVIMVHLVAIVALVMDLDAPWLQNTAWMGPSVAVVAFTIAILRRMMANRGWAAVREVELVELVEKLKTTPHSQSLQAALATRAQKQGWLSWSCVMDTVASQGLSQGEIDYFRACLLSSWGPVFSMSGPVATRHGFRRYLDSTAWNHASLEVNTQATAPSMATPLPARF